MHVREVQALPSRFLASVFCFTVCCYHFQADKKLDSNFQLLEKAAVLNSKCGEIQRRNHQQLSPCVVLTKGKFCVVF